MGRAGLEEYSRRPKVSPAATPDRVEALVAQGTAHFERFHQPFVSVREKERRGKLATFSGMPTYRDATHMLENPGMPGRSQSLREGRLRAGGAEKRA